MMQLQLNFKIFIQLFGYNFKASKMTTTSNNAVRRLEIEAICRKCNNDTAYHAKHFEAINARIEQLKNEINEEDERNGMAN